MLDRHRDSQQEARIPEGIWHQVCWLSRVLKTSCGGRSMRRLQARKPSVTLNPKP